MEGDRMMIEGYEVIRNKDQPDMNGAEDVVTVKQEPVDAGYETNATAAPAANGSQSTPRVETNSGDAATRLSTETSLKIREILKSMVENPSKELSIKSVVGDLLQNNDLQLSNDVKASLSTPLSIKKTDDVKPADSIGQATTSTILHPKSPTRSCTLPKDGLSNINEALVEEQVVCSIGGAAPQMVCAVGSKIMLMTPKGVPLPMDITYYWCNFCSFRSDKKEQLLEHIMEHRFHCKYCKYQSFSRADVIHHCSETHETFAETATSLKYCTFIPDYLQLDNQKDKRKRDGVGETGRGKRKKTAISKDSSDDQFQMEVDEVDDPEPAEVGAQRIIAPSDRVRKATARKSLPAPKIMAPAPPLKLVPGVGTSIPQLVPAATGVTGTQQGGGLPVITNVMSGHKAVSEATAGYSPSTASPKRQSTVTVSSGLCWNCGYCGFVTLSQSFLKIHLNANHQGKAHKYVAMLVSSEEEMNRIKQSDTLMVNNPAAPVAVAAIASTSGAKASATSGAATATVSATNSQIEIDNAESETPVQPKSLEEEEQKIPISFKCAHCNFSSPQSDKVKTHLLQRHMGSVMYALDMRAVKLKQRRYVFFCMKNKCGFNTKLMEEYQEHVSSCTPWLDGKARKDVDLLMIKSLELTIQFTTKINSSTSTLGKDVKTDKNAEYGCIYCTYLSNNNTRLKKHVLANHKDRNCIIRDQHNNSKHPSQNVYFCKHCLWESRVGSELELHVRERHNDQGPAMPVSTPAATATAPTPAPVLSPKPEKTTTALPRPGRGRPPKQVAVTSSHESSPSLSTSSEEVDEDSQDDDFSGVVPEAEVQKAMTQYVADEASREKQHCRPTRDAALRAHVKVRAVGHQPTLYRCFTCGDVVFGVRLMRGHIRDNHSSSPLRAVDVKKQSHGSSHATFFCPKETCIYSSTNSSDVVKHGKKEHNLDPSDDDLTRITNIFKSPSHTSPSGKGSSEMTFECLYCNTSKVFHSHQDVKSHLQSKHKTEQFVFRDVMARKMRQTSRFNICKVDNCIFVTTDNDEYSCHVLAHNNGRIFECSRCAWFNEAANLVTLHISDSHPGGNAVPTEMALSLDTAGNVVRAPTGVTIKAEPV